MRDFRIRTENAEELILLLKKEGFSAEISKCKPKTTWGSGCTDPNCCSQHPEALIEEVNGIKFVRMPDHWTAITTNASSNTIHGFLQTLYPTPHRYEKLFHREGKV